MKVEIKDDPKEQVVETPAEEVVETPTPIVAPDSEKVRQLEIENAELRGRASALQSVAKPEQNTNQDQWKSIVLADINGMNDEDFKTKYKYEKFQATAAILERDHNIEKAKIRQDVAELRAENRMAAKYGKDFYDVKSEVDDMVSQASMEVRQDPEKLSKFMEKAYLAASKDKKPSVALIQGEKTKGDGVNKRIVSNFEKPTPTSSGSKREEANSDELAEDIRELGRAFKITSEKERQELLKDDFVPIDLGGGLVFRDPKKGVEKVA